MLIKNVYNNTFVLPVSSNDMLWIALIALKETCREWGLFLFYFFDMLHALNYFYTIDDVIRALWFWVNAGSNIMGFV